MRNTENKSDFTYDVVNDLGTIQESPSEVGYDVRVKVIKWGDSEAKLDIRKWNKENNKFSKGISISFDAALVLKEIIDKIDSSMFK